MIRSLFLTFILLSSSFSFGSQINSNDLKQASLVIPKALLEMGIERMGEVDLRQLSQELETVQWEINSSGLTLSGSGKPRTTAIYLTEEKKVIWNGPVPAMSILPVIAFHEAKGALGYKDEVGEMSVSMAAELIRRRKHSSEAAPLKSLQKPFVNVQKRSKNEKYQSSGGATSVGGGGDAVTWDAKLMTVLTLTEMLQPLDPAGIEFKRIDIVLEKILKTEFENNTKVQISEAVFELKGEHETVLIPYAEWLWTMMNPESKFAEQKRSRILSQIVNHFLQGQR